MAPRGALGSRAQGEIAVAGDAAGGAAIAVVWAPRIWPAGGGYAAQLLRWAGGWHASGVSLSL